MENIFLVLVIAVLGILVRTLSLWNNIVDDAKKKAIEHKLLKDINSLSNRDISFEDLVDYCAALANMRRLLASGKININSHQLETRGHAAIYLLSMRILFKRHPVSTMITALLFLPLPIGWLAIAVFAALTAFQSHQAAQFQVMVRQALNTGTEGSQTNVGSVDQIAKLHELLKAGALTREEFEQEKLKILKRAA